VPIKELIGCHGGGDDDDGNDDNYDYDDVSYRSADEVYQLQTAVGDFLIISAHRPTQNSLRGRRRSMFHGPSMITVSTCTYTPKEC